MNPKLHPIWKQAVADLVALNPQPGYVITEDWLLEHLELPRPVRGGVAEVDKWRLRYVGYRDQFLRKLEEEHGLIFTSSERVSGGLRLLHPREVADYEDTQWRKRLGAEVRRTVRRLEHTAVQDMTAPEIDRHLSVLNRRKWQARQLRDSQKAEIPPKFAINTLPKLQAKSASSSALIVAEGGGEE